jgi:hypothetical protein
VTFATQSSPLHGHVPAFFGLFLLAASSKLPAASQPSTRKIQVETSIYAQANGARLGALHPGATVTVRRTTGDWQQVTFEGWIITTSIGPSTRPEFSLAVSAAQGERIRGEPDGEVVARAVRGTGFTRLSRRGGWTQIRRSAWIQLSAPTAQKPVASAQAPAPSPQRPAAGDTSREARVASRESVTTPPTSGPSQPGSERVLVRKGAGLALGPGGASVGTAPDGLQADVMERSGNWVRIRTDSWVLAEDVVPMPPDSARLTLEQLRADPARYVGQPVTWRLQFLSVQTADELRPELPPGMPYLLARGPLPDAGFVYVAVTAEQVARFRAMNPLDEFVAHGTIRAARTKYLPTPVIDLIR